MIETVFPVLPVLIICHAWMTIMLAHTLGEIELFSLSPESFPA